MPIEDSSYIDGRFATGSGERFEIYNPATGHSVGTVAETTSDQVQEAVDAARRAQPAWARLPAIERAGHVRAVARKVREKRDELAEIITREQGKILPLARTEVDFTADYMDYMAEWARRIEGEIITSDRPSESILLFRKPVGVVAGILPWNFPFFLIARKMAPALVAGNTIVIKPSEETPLNAIAFTRLLAEAGLPAGVFNLVHGKGSTAGQALASNPSVNMVSFTGSVATGSRIMQTAGLNLTRVNLELGGKAPAIVLADADIEVAARAIYSSRVINTGQVCNCAERIYVERPVADAFVEKLVGHMRSTRYGDPLADPDLHMGPLINAAGLAKVRAMVERAVADGAKVETGGRTADLGQGFHYEPTVLTGCRSDMQIMRSEIFGPVAPIQVVDSLEEAVALANDSEYGLTSSLYTRDISKSMRACRDLQFGETYVNRENFEAMQGFHAGRRKSGIGGADGKHGFYEFMETQVVYIEHG